jgi:hypothetical protein
MKWLRLYNDTITDPKWRVVAAESGQPLPSVLAVWMSMLINAGDADERGTLQGWDDRFAGAAIDLRGDAVRSIREAMQGVVLDGMRLTGWDKRQRASDDAGGRQRKTRERRERKPPGGDGGSHGGNGRDHDCDDGVTRQRESVARQTDDVARQSHDVAEKPLTLTLLPTSTLIKDDDETAGAREVATLVAGLSGVVDKRGVATVQAWLAKGYHPQLDIYPVVQEVTTRAPGAIGSLRYFTDEIDRHHAARTSPQQEPSNVLPIRPSAQQRRGSAGCATGGVAAGRVLARLLAPDD